MKFSELKHRYSELKEKYGGKKHIKNKDLTALKASLAERMEKYEKKLASEPGEHKRKKLKLRIKVIKAQLKKIDKLLDD